MWPYCGNSDDYVQFSSFDCCSADGSLDCRQRMSPDRSEVVSDKLDNSDLLRLQISGIIFEVRNICGCGRKILFLKKEELEPLPGFSVEGDVVAPFCIGS